MMRYFLSANINSLWCSLCQFAISMHIGGTDNGWKLEKLWQQTSGSEDCFLIRMFFGCKRKKTHWNNCQPKGELGYQGSWKCRHHMVTDPLSSSWILSYQYGSQPQAAFCPGGSVVALSVSITDPAPLTPRAEKRAAHFPKLYSLISVARTEPHL